ncbi:MAG: hypothetical protein ACHQJ6_06145 [Candidatus Berkiellales bacterium]
MSKPFDEELKRLRKAKTSFLQAVDENNSKQMDLHQKELEQLRSEFEFILNEDNEDEILPPDMEDISVAKTALQNISDALLKKDELIKLKRDAQLKRDEQLRRPSQPQTKPPKPLLYESVTLKEKEKEKSFLKELNFIFKEMVNHANSSFGFAAKEFEREIAEVKGSEAKYALHYPKGTKNSLVNRKFVKIGDFMAEAYAIPPSRDQMTIETVYKYRDKPQNIDTPINHLINAMTRVNDLRNLIPKILPLPTNYDVDHVTENLKQLYLYTLLLIDILNESNDESLKKMIPSIQKLYPAVFHQMPVYVKGKSYGTQELDAEYVLIKKGHADKKDEAIKKAAAVKKEGVAPGSLPPKAGK